MDTKYRYLKASGDKTVGEIVQLDANAPGTKSLLDDGFIELAETDPVLDEVKKFADDLTKTNEALAETKTELAETKKQLVEVSAKFAGRPDIKVGNDQNTQDTLGGFKSVGHFINDVLKAGTPNASPSEAYGKYAAVVQKTGQTEADGDQGGILVPAAVSNVIFKKVFEESALMSRCDVRPIAGNSMEFPIAKEDSRVDGSRHAGVTAAWLGEGGQSTIQDLSGLEMLNIKLHKLQVLCAATDELLADAPTAAKWITDTVSSEIAFQAERAIFEGDGIAKPHGFTNANAYIAAAARSVATGLNGEDIYSMWERLHPSSQKNAVWLIGNEVVAPLHRAYDYDMEGTKLSSWPIMVPAGGLSGAPYSTVLDKPVLSCEFCSALNTVDDICLVDLSQYLVATKRGGSSPVIDTQISIHLLFDYAKTAFRFMFRMDGKSWWPAAVTPLKGTLTTSPFVGLTAV